MNEGPSWKGLPLRRSGHAIDRCQNEGITLKRLTAIVEYGWEDYGGGPGENLVTDGELMLRLARDRKHGQSVWVITTVEPYLDSEGRRRAALGERVYKRRPAAISRW